jgi:HD superfamily phosphodiesterase
MELHCLRCRHIAAEIARGRGWRIDDELLTIAAILHDIGLYPLASRGGVYTSDGALLARELLAAHGWEQERMEHCAIAIDCHHDLRSQLGRGAEAEALRLADRVELSGGLIRAGVKRRWLRDLRSEFPSRGLAQELAREVGRALRERPLTMARIFLRPSR